MVVGAGAVGVEFASIFRTFGTEVTILEALPRIVPLEDEEISPELEKAFKKKGIQIETERESRVREEGRQGRDRRVQGQDRKVAVDFRGKGADRRGPPPTDRKHAASKRRRSSSSGVSFTPTHTWKRTSRSLYAIGDIVAGLPQLAHAASMEGIIAVGRMAGKDVQPFDRKRCPNCTYCEPQIGSIGLTEKQARDAGFDVKTGKFPFLANSKATILGKHDGFIKVVAEAKYGEILGVHAIGPLATEIISEPAAALSLEATLDDMANVIHAHPTVWEAMGDAFNSVRGLAINY